MVVFRALGTTELQRDNQNLKGVSASPKRLGLLAYLALARPRGFRRRDELVALLWPELGQKAARNALRNTLYHLRQALGKGVIANRGAEEVGVRRDLIWTDATVFEEALGRGDVGEALELYRGDLLVGFHIPTASHLFHQWLEQERQRLRTLALEGAGELSDEAEESGEITAALRWAKHAAGLEPFSEEAHVRLIKLLRRVGKRADALQSFENFAARLREELEMDPSPAILRLAEGIRSQADVSSASNASPVSKNARGITDRTIAVLPFETLGSSENTAFTDGIHRDLLTRLASVADLRVIAHTSTRTYHIAEKPISDIGKELGVVWVMEGDVQESNHQFRVNVRLVEAAQGRQAWSQTFGGELTAESVLDIQSQITKKIGESLEAELTPEEQKQVERRPTKSLEAYRLHAQGRRALDQRTEGGLRKAVDFFERAIDLDPGYALGWVGLADALGLLHAYGYEEANAVLPRAENAIWRALEEHPESAEAHASLGRFLGQYNQALAAERSLKRAIELKPSYAEAHNWRSVGHQILGNHEAALESSKRAVELNPLSLESILNLAFSYLINGEHEMALFESRRARELAPSYEGGAFWEGLTLYEMGRFEEAVSVLRDVTVSWGGSGPQATLALAYFGSGEIAAARDQLTRIEAVGRAFDAGLVNAGLGQIEESFEALGRVDFRSLDMASSYWPTVALRYVFQTVWDELRDDPRFERLLRRVDLSWGLNADGGPPSDGASAKATELLVRDKRGGEVM